MLRLIGTTVAACVLIVIIGSSAALAYDSPQKYGFELRPAGWGWYDTGDISTSIEKLAIPGRYLNDDLVSSGNGGTVMDNGPIAGLSFLYRPARHMMWEFGYNAILDVDNTVDNARKDSSAQILMHANEFFLKGNIVMTPASVVNIELGAGVSYYNAELQIQDDFAGRYNYDAVGRSWGLITTAGIEILPSKRVGVVLQGGARVTNAANFSYDAGGGSHTSVPVIGGTRPIEVNLTGAFASLGLRFYFDRVTKPVDFAR